MDNGNLKVGKSDEILALKYNNTKSIDLEDKEAAPDFIYN